MLFKYNYYDLPDRNDGSKDLKMQDGKKKFVPEFADGSTHDLEDQIEVESDDAVNNNIMMVVTYRKSRPKRMGAAATKVRSTLPCSRGGRRLAQQYGGFWNERSCELRWGISNLEEGSTDLSDDEESDDDDLDNPPVEDRRRFNH